MERARLSSSSERTAVCDEPWDRTQEQRAGRELGSPEAVEDGLPSLGLGERWVAAALPFDRNEADLLAHLGGKAERLMDAARPAYLRRVRGPSYRPPRGGMHALQ